LLRSFPRIVRNEISVHIIQSRTHILNTYDEALSKYAEVCFLPFRDCFKIHLTFHSRVDSLGMVSRC
jgi:hypothetical protein